MSRGSIWPAIGAKTELSETACAAYRAVRVCYAEAIGCRGQQTLPTCKSELARLYETIDCDFCTPLPWAVVTSAGVVATTPLYCSLFSDSQPR
jgi:hypothetical protein